MASAAVTEISSGSGAQQHGGTQGGKDRARTSEILSPVGSEKKVKNSGSNGNGESDPTYYDDGQREDSDSSVELTQTLQHDSCESDLSGMESQENSEGLSKPLPGGAVTQVSNSEGGDPDVTPRRVPRRNRGQHLADGNSIHKVSSLTNINDITNRRLLKGQRSHSATSVRSSDTQSENLFTLSMFSQLRRDIKSDMENLLTAQIQSVKQDLTDTIMKIDSEVKENERRLDLVPDLIDAKIADAREPIDGVIGNISKNVADLDIKTTSMNDQMLKLENEVKSLSTKLASCENLADPKTVARLENAERRIRTDDLIIEGLRIHPGDSLQRNVIREVDRVIKFRLYPRDFRHVSVFSTGTDGKITAVKVTFFNPQCKPELMRRRGRLRGTGIFLKEYLTITQKLLLDEARIAVKNGIFTEIWSKDGLIWGVEKPGDKPNKIYDLDRLKEFNQQAEKKKKEEKEAVGSGATGESGPGKVNDAQSLEARKKNGLAGSKSSEAKPSQQQDNAYRDTRPAYSSSRDGRRDWSRRRSRSPPRHHYDRRDHYRGRRSRSRSRDRCGPQWRKPSQHQQGGPRQSAGGKPVQNASKPRNPKPPNMPKNDGKPQAKDGNKVRHDGSKDRKEHQVRNKSSSATSKKNGPNDKNGGKPTSRASVEQPKSREGYAAAVKGTPCITGFFAAQSKTVETTNRFEVLSEPMDEA